MSRSQVRPLVRVPIKKGLWTWRNWQIMIKWNNSFSYAVGLFTADGNLSSDGRHLEFYSKDLELIKTLKRCLNLNNRITRKQRGQYPKKWYHRIQFGNKELYKFFIEIGLMPNKSRLLADLNIPKRYFSDFLRGLIDGDGSIDITEHPESRFKQLKIRITSGSIRFLKWLNKYIFEILKIRGRIFKSNRSYQLTFYKINLSKIFKYIYNSKKQKMPYLIRKYRKLKSALRADGGIGRHVSLRS